MSNKSIIPQDERAQRKALLMAKIYAERELINLQVHRIANDVKPSTIRTNIVNGAVAKFQGTRVARSLFAYIERHPTVSWSVAQLLMRSVKKNSSSKSSIWRPLVMGVASWFVASRKRSARRAEAARNKPLTGPRVKAQSKPIKYVDESPEARGSEMTRRRRAVREEPRPKRRLRRRIS